MTNFDFLKSEPRFDSFANAAISAEKILPIDTSAAAVQCRSAMEQAIKFMYSVDSFLEKPWSDKLVALMGADTFRALIGNDLYYQLDFIRKVGNSAAHGGRAISRDQAVLCLRNLFVFLDYVAYCYGSDKTTDRAFNPELLSTTSEAHGAAPPEVPEPALDEMMKENAEARLQMSERGKERRQTYVPKSADVSEFSTRRLYIDVMLEDAGWIRGADWLDEYQIDGMPNASGVGFADYALLRDDGRVLAIVEAKKTCVDVVQGRQQAKLYADLIGQKQGFRPVVFLTNGFETRIDDNQYPERRVATIYSRRDLEKLFNLRRERQSLAGSRVDEYIAGRHYQIAAVKAVCEDLEKKNRRKSLLVMATGSGKTRTVVALCKILIDRGWVKNFLFLADRSSLVTQAKRSFVNLLPSLSVTNLCEDKGNCNARGVFSTYQTMINCVDVLRDEKGRIFSNAHFDLIVCDEAHRSIYKKYGDIFNYFDAPLVGLTATPKDDVDKNTYEVFELENGAPTYGYELAEAVRDGFLVSYKSIETKLKLLDQGIVYDELSEEEKEEYEETFTDENGILPEQISPNEINRTVFNTDTIRTVLDELMTKGLKIDYGNKIGKTIIFAVSHKHAEKIYEVFSREYPRLVNYAKVIDNYTNYSQSAIDEFSDPDKLPQIAISVDMLDTGIDIPEILNLVFFKKVMSKSKFWQMIGRGTRLCPGLLDGVDKEGFLIFDYCCNFEFFRTNKGEPATLSKTLPEQLFILKFEIVRKLQDLKYQTDELIQFREGLVDDMLARVRELNRKNFIVAQHLQYVDRYSARESYNAISYEETRKVREELAPLTEPIHDDPHALRFDALMYGIELAWLAGESLKRGFKDLRRKVEGVKRVANIRAIAAQSELIEKILHGSYLESAEINEFEIIRERLRDLMKYVPKDSVRYDTDFTEEVLESDVRPPELESDDLQNYREKAEYYVREHQDNPVVAKLKGNVPLTEDDVKELERILWSELGTKEDYEREFGEKTLGEFVRGIVGLDRDAANAAFATFLNDSSLDTRQRYFIQQIVDYIVKNGMLTDRRCLLGEPFNKYGSVSEIFAGSPVWKEILAVIDQINANATAS
ncbi:MAG: DEAD/DEAH box helicase family protein [Thermoguttaceae bacterium]|nr:DEAD/DEAH box helicase family protein [Thermoguttaceae bacterium]